jgi:4'-phosphopantetheinyl transferase EntD
MIEEIVSGQVVAVEASDDRGEAPLFAGEEAFLAGAIDKRRREFATGRTCARLALQQLGFPASPILRGSRGEPLWPEGVVGSITHCDGYRAAAVARSSEIVTIGIDAEPHAQLPDGVLGQIALADELAQLRRLRSEQRDMHWDRLLFSAKESVYKAWFPLAKSWLGFEDVSVSLETGTHTFVARLLLSGPRPTLADGSLDGFSGGWMVGEGLVLTAVVTARASSG